MGLVKFHSALANNFEEYDKAFPDQLTRLRIDIAYIGLSVTYIVWLFQHPKRKESTFLRLLGYGAIFLVISFITYPRSTDIYLYLQYGLMGLHKINPYLNAANSFASHLSPLISWSQTSTYGPVSQLFFAIAASLTRLSPLVGIYVFKLFCVVLHITNTYLIWQLLRSSDHRRKITLAYLINPLLLTEHIISAHVDVFIANAVLLLAICLFQHYYSLGISAIWLGLLEKTLPIIWLPLVLNFLIYKRRWRSIAISAFVSVLIIAIVSFIALPTLDAWKSLINPGVKGKTALSLHYLLNSLLLFLPLADQTKEKLLSMFTLTTYIGFIVYYSLILLKPYFKRRYSEVELFTDIGWVTLILFLFATPWLMPWYPSILLAIAALSTNSPLFVLVSLTFSLSSNFIYGGAGSGISAFSIFSTLTIIGPPILMLVAGPQFLNRISSKNV